MTPRTQRLVAYSTGVVFVVALLVLAVAFPNPTPFQSNVFRIVLALAAAGFAATIPGFISIEIGTWLRAGGALAVFAIVYFYNPAQLVAQPPEPSPSPDIVILDTWRTDSVANGPTQAAKFSISTPYRITDIRNYHWNNGSGSSRGNIALRRDDGTIFGPWEVSTSPGSFGREHVNWECSPNVAIPAGTYTVVDSDPATWSYSDKSAGRGMTIIKGRKLTES